MSVIRGLTGRRPVSGPRGGRQELLGGIRL